MMSVDENLLRLEAKVDKLTEAVMRLVLIEERQSTQGERLSAAEWRHDHYRGKSDIDAARTGKQRFHHGRHGPRHGVEGVVVVSHGAELVRPTLEQHACARREQWHLSACLNRRGCTK